MRIGKVPLNERFMSPIVELVGEVIETASVPHQIVDLSKIEDAMIHLEGGKSAVADKDVPSVEQKDELGTAGREQLATKVFSFDESIPVSELQDFVEEGPYPASIGELPIFSRLEQSDVDIFVEKLEQTPKERLNTELTEEDRQALKEETGWSDAIVNAIRTKEEAEIYIEAGLVEGEVNGKPALLQPSIDGDACNEPKWPDWSNKDLAEEGYAPRDEKGCPYELHHIGQDPDSPLAELTYDQHHSDGNFKVLHTFEESSINRVEFNNERKAHWEARSETM